MEKEKYQLFYYDINIDKLIKNNVQYITYQDYLKYKNIMQLAEPSEKYKLDNNKKEMYDKKKLKEIYNIHDKLIKRVLGTTKEMASFLNQFLDLPEEIKEENLEQCSTEFITKNYKTKYSDLIFKLKNEEIYFLIEHQSTVDKRMIERIGIYV